MIRGTAVLFVLLLADVAYADCSILGQQAKQADTRLESAMQRYKAAAAELPRSVDRSTKYSDALAARGEFLEALNASITLLEQGKAEGCFGRQYEVWNNTLETLKARRIEFQREREALLSVAPAAREDKGNKTTRGKTSIELMNEKLDATLKSMNERAPIEIDSKTVLTKAQRSGMVITYTYKLSISKALWLAAMEKSLTQSTIEHNCTTESVRTLLGLGYEFRHVTFDPADSLLANILVTAKKCEETPAR